MIARSRREFLTDVGKGMMVASVGATLASDLGVGSALADDSEGALSFGPMEPLVALMQDTPVQHLQPMLVEKLRSGTTLPHRYRPERWPRRARSGASTTSAITR